jgi:hypothetical protein
VSGVCLCVVFFWGGGEDTVFGASSSVFVVCFNRKVLDRGLLCAEVRATC